MCCAWGSHRASLLAARSEFSIAYPYGSPSLLARNPVWCDSLPKMQDAPTKSQSIRPFSPTNAKSQVPLVSLFTIQYFYAVFVNLISESSAHLTLPC